MTQSIADVLDALSPFDREQMERMRDGEVTWSGTHGWPGTRDRLECRGLIKSINGGTWNRKTVITDLGREVRLALREAAAKAREQSS